MHLKRYLAFAIGCLWLIAVDALAQGPVKPSKISQEIIAHQKEKRRPAGVKADAHARKLMERGLNSKNLDGEDCALYVAQPLTEKKKADLRSRGIIVHETYVPPVPGKHPNGFYLATVSYSSLSLIENDPQLVRLETTEQLATPMNDLGAAMTHVNDVQNGTGVTTRTGAGVKIAIADSGVDLTHADIPTPAEVYDMTDGTGPSSWGTNVANTVTPHGTHVTGTVLGRGTLSGGKYKGMAPGATLYFYKIGNDTTASSTETDEVEAINRAQAVGCKIFSMSYGGIDAFQDGSSASCQAIDAATASGMTCFISAGNDGNKGAHTSMDLPSGVTSPTFNYTTTAGAVAAGGTIDFRVIWRDGNAGDANVNLACTNLGSGESLTLAFSSWSSRGTDAKRYTLTTNQASGASKTYTFTLQNTAGSGNTPKVHVYDVSGKGTFANPDPAYTIGNPALADGAIAVGAWTQRKTWTDYTNKNWQYSSLTVGTLAPFSSLGPRIDGVMKPDLVAPGAATISARDSVAGLAATGALIIDNDGLNLNGSGPANYYVMQGTSMACPHAAGLAALLLEDQPSLTPAQLKTALTATASKADTPDNTVGNGLLNALAAIGTNAAPTTVTLGPISPDPRSDTVTSVSVQFLRNVTGVGIEDFSLTRDGSPVALNGASVTGSGSSYQVLGLGPLTGASGSYVLTLTAAGSSIQDSLGKALATDASESWVMLDQISITVTPSTWALGAVGLNHVGQSGPFTVTNRGNVAETITIQATDGDGGWKLADAKGLNAFSLEADRSNDGSYELTVSKTAQPLFVNQAFNTSQTLGLRYSAPSRDSFGGGVSQGFMITVRAAKAP